MACVLRQLTRQVARMSVSARVTMTNTSSPIMATTTTTTFPAASKSILAQPQWSCVRCSSSESYDPDSKFETASPFKAKLKRDYGYKYQMFSRGTLPRPKEEYSKDVLPMPAWKPWEKNQWTKKKALFGQNDYIDLLGDGSIHPWQLIDAPVWLRGFKGNELQRIVRRLQHGQKFIKEMQPTKHHSMRKQLFFLYERLNKRHHTKYWGSKIASAKGRIERIRDF